MTETRDVTPTQARPVTQQERSEEWGWYLYGITRCGWNPRTMPADSSGTPAGKLADGGSEPVCTLEAGSLAAVVRPVRLSELNEGELQSRSSDPAWLEAI